GTFNYWQAWVFLTVFAVTTWIPTIYLLRNNPAALERRFRGPLSEARALQKLIVSVLVLSLVAMIMVSALDHRFGWSPMPATLCLVGDILLAIGIGLAMLVIIQNGYAGGTVTIETGHKLASTGLYALVRHPMYAGSIVMMAGIPLALGSYWGLFFVI